MFLMLSTQNTINKKLNPAKTYGKTKQHCNILSRPRNPQSVFGPRVIWYSRWGEKIEDV